VAIITVGLIFTAALVYDGGQIIATYRQAGDLAANAARAAAQGIDPASLRTGPVRLDPDDAQQRASAFLADAGHPGTGTVTVDDDRVTVTVTLTPDSHLLPLGSRQIRAQATAAPTRGVDQPGEP
jgi:Flp pilus assembly protein TadG